MAGLVPFNRRKQSLLGSSIDDFQNMLDDFFSESWLPNRNLMRDTFKIDVEEANNEYLIHAELPGIQKNEVNLDMNEGRFTITVNKEENVNEEKKNYIHRERRFSSMSRSIYLSDAKADNIKAKLEDGVLSVTIQKQEKLNNSVKIEIE